MKKFLTSVSVLAFVLQATNAQVAEWGQCGGIGWTGGTTCVAGTTCVYSNAYYSQCLPGAAPAPTTTITTTTTTKPTTTAPTTTAPTTAPSSTPTGSGSAPGLAQIQYLFTFGDSYTDTGFNYNGTLAGPSNGNPLGNPTFPGVTSSGGENWVGYLISSFNKTRTYSYNFAYSGATLDSSLAAPYSSSVVSVRNQIEQEFLPGLAKKPASVPWSATNSLFAIFDGINDVLNIDGNPNQASAQAPFFTLYNTLVNELYTAGARNFLFIGVPAIDLTPFVVQQGTANPGLAKTSLEAWNNNVQIVMNTLLTNHSDATARYVDLETLFRSIVANPSTVGVSNASALWYNTLHPIPAVQKAMAQTIAGVIG
ncbi:carbohydrate esterase family 16 protein [Sphaerobolus stellatus SS14]|nr:carbohydrate esterase family 16 protein [Sphaerobolus stellatus SS14]